MTTLARLSYVRANTIGATLCTVDGFRRSIKQSWSFSLVFIFRPKGVLLLAARSRVATL